MSPDALNIAQEGAVPPEACTLYTHVSGEVDGNAHRPL